MDLSVDQNTLRSSTRHWAQFFSGRPGPGFSPPTIVPNITRRVSRSLCVLARSPSRLCSRVGKICFYGDALSTIFLLACFCALLPTFRFSFFFSFFSYSFPASRYVYRLVASSVQQPSATLSKYVFYSTCSCLLYTSPSPRD